MPEPPQTPQGFLLLGLICRSFMLALWLISAYESSMITMACPKCGGNGTVPMTSALLEMLSLVKRMPGKTAPEYINSVHSQLVTTSFNNRLEELRRLGLVRRERDGKSFRYFPI